MDSEFLAISFAFILLGAAGIVLFSGPLTPAGDSCYCLIPSPEPGAAQGTSSIFLALGVMFFPMGLMKGGLPSFRRAPGPESIKLHDGSVIVPIKITSGSLFTFGLAVVLIGVDLVFVPGYLILKNQYFELAGVMLIAAGATSMLWGQTRPEK